ncbi:DUF982 domain-containing protein [Ochrobactrum sp. LMG 5442]|nr:DUF982 domain-containing protein [Ochrobactrum sp. LMG 5442]
MLESTGFHVTWNKPVVVKSNNLLYNIASARNAEWFLLKHWPLFEPSDLDEVLLSCLLSWPENAAAEQRARVKFIRACANAGILAAGVANGGDVPQHIIPTKMRPAASGQPDICLPPSALKRTPRNRKRFRSRRASQRRVKALCTAAYATAQQFSIRSRLVFGRLFRLGR